MHRNNRGNSWGPGGTNNALESLDAPLAMAGQVLDSLAQSRERGDDKIKARLVKIANALKALEPLLGTGSSSCSPEDRAKAKKLKAR